MPLDLSRYLVEWYRPDLTDELLELTTARIDDSADRLSAGGSSIHLGELAGVIALALSGAAVNGWLARIGLGAAMLGQLLLVAAELIYPSSPAIGDQMFNIGPPLSAIGLLLAGVAVIRARRWGSWHRFMPLASAPTCSSS
ncbi:MAG: hypothetical protein DLM61_12010 [Pseudonocardiales bacterium]|nr:hypothetical protein [Pseudonocardiales bacterium]PZS29917.1 MAG: hypothetical protein DLM61_12010 [Pseudonocardiales bacterium]